MIQEHFFDNQTQLLDTLLADCIRQLQQGLATKERASFLVSGGSTPKPLYQRLSTAELGWENIDIALVDERWVEPGTAGSNETFVRDNLLLHQASKANYIPTKTAHASSHTGLSHCETHYRQLCRPFDLLILGMGPDAHTASLFPQADGLEQALDTTQQQLCAAIMAQPSEVTGDHLDRLTLSLYGLLQARQLHLLITGDEKRRVYEQAKHETDVRRSPISALLHQQEVDIHVYWAP